MIYGNFIPTILMMQMKQNSKRKRIFFPLFFFIALSVGGYYFLQYLQSDNQIQVITYQVKDGWGYKIMVQDRYIITQPFIPAIQGERQFPDKRTASKAGNMVKQKLSENKLPSLTLEDLESIGIDSLGNSY